MSEECNENDKQIPPNENRTVSSFGITIDTEHFQSATINEEDYGELHSLGINAFEQEQFEKGVINQVDSAIAKAESNFHQNVAKKEVEKLHQEISNITKEIEEIENIFTSAKNGDPLASRRISFSLLQQKTGKENKLKKLKSDLNAASIHLDGLKTNKEIVPSNEHQNLIDLGEITPFDALQMKGQPVHNQDASNKKDLPAVAASVNASTDPTGPIDFELLHNSKKKDQNVVTKRKSPQPKNKKNTDEDEDYIPVEENSASDYDDSADDQMNTVVDKRKQGKKIKTQKISKNINSTKKSERIVDDGHFSSFRERQRKVHIKKKLKEAYKKGEVMELEYEEEEPDFFSSDNEDEVDEVSIEDDFVLPQKIWKKLYRYQRVGVKWLWQLHKQQTGGIVGDEMGLGKTIQIIAFLVGLMQPKTKHAMKSFHGKEGLGSVLIVCPGTVLHQWVAEFQKWWPSFRVAVLHDSGSFVGKKAALIKAINKHPGILVTTYAGVRLNKEELYRYYWHYVILDEGHKIRNPDSEVTLACKQFDTPHRLILTGTPMQNSLKELWSLFDFVFPGRLGTLPVFMTEFSVPITMGGYANATAVQVQTAHRCATVLKDSINPYMLRRMKKDVQMSIQLPPKSEQVLFCKLSDEQKTLYEQYIKSAEVTNILQGRMKVFPGLIKLRKICNHPDLAFYDQESATQMKESSPNGVIPSATDDKILKYGYWKRSGKMLVVEGLLRMWKEKGHRVLLFSQSKQMLNIMESFLNSVPYSYLRMDGGTNIGSRQSIVKKFDQDPSIFVFLLTTRVGGLGLNLIAADRVIIFDPDWNPSTDTQARERAWRIGQDKHVTIYRLMTTGTIEEKIYHRQIFKQFLTNRVLANPFQRRFFKSNDLYELFSLEDIGPMQSTETGAIFAGTGSEIRMRKKKNDKPVKQTTQKRKNTDTSYCSTGTAPKKISLAVSNSTDPVSDAIPLGKRDQAETSKPDRVQAKKKQKRKKKSKQVEIDGTTVENVEKVERYNRSERDEDEEEQTVEKKKSENDILMSLFRSSGIHSALKHDKIEQAGNPDYVLVEKEAERVAKQAINALRHSRAQCRSNGYAVPTWTGRSNVDAGTIAQSVASKKKRFGKKNNIGSTTTSKTADSADMSQMEERSPSRTSNNSPKFDIESEAIDVSSSALLARMRRRNAAVGSGTVGDGTSQTTEDILLKDIEQFVKAKPDNTATSEELTEFFRERLKPGQNAVFKQLLKQLCTLKKENGIGIWEMREEFR